MNTYAISDIHGEIDLFNEALRWVVRDAEGEANLILLGDYVDRGPRSRGVVTVVRSLVRGAIAGISTIALKGNHEDMMTRAVLDNDDQWVFNWLRNGGGVALNEYSKPGHPPELDHDALRADAEFLRGLPMTHEDEQRIYVHAGLRAGVSLAEQHPMDALWMRPKEFDQEIASPDWSHAKLVVHGHTPRNRGSEKRLCIDGGACFKDGHLLIAKFVPGRVNAERVFAIGRPREEQAA